ncbi:MAG: putative PIN and TRAM-domain containing protein YacL [Chlamydiae bacterium]|nr:putative PIN and TRAM-domain containing protein YacL [Chlamydiota bacterium]
MTSAIPFVRILFVLLSLIFMITFAIGVEESPTIWTYAWGAGLGLVLGGVLLGIDHLFRRFNLRSFTVVVLGLFIGYLMSLALILIFDAIIEIAGAHPDHFLVEIVKIFLFLFGTYLGVIMILRASDEIYVSIPFVKFSPSVERSKEIVLDPSALQDPRIIDLAASGLLDKRLILPRFLMRSLQRDEESHDEEVRRKAKRGFEVVQKLEQLPELSLRFHETDFPEVKEITEKSLRLARLLDADLLSADINRIQMAQIEGVRVFNIHSLSNALKPLMPRGEILKIKIQRYGKEEMQGVGYLEDGTMVVVNGGADFIGETVEAHVLSVKHTSSGRIIFCNVAEEC